MADILFIGITVICFAGFVALTLASERL